MANKTKYQKPANRAVATADVETRTAANEQDATPAPADETAATPGENVPGVAEIRFRVLQPFAEVVDGETRHFKPGEITSLPADRVAALGDLVKEA